MSTIDVSAAAMDCKKNRIIDLEQRRLPKPTSLPSSHRDNSSSNNDEPYNHHMVSIPSLTSVSSAGDRRASNDTVLSIIDAALSILESEVEDSGGSNQRWQ